MKKPYLSLAFILLSLFSIVFCKVEVTRLGYTVLRQLHQYKGLEDKHRLQVMEYARFVSPQNLRELAKNSLTLENAQAGQIIQLSGNRVAIRQ